jgi:hypothetical protein
MLFLIEPENLCQLAAERKSWAGGTNPAHRQRLPLSLQLHVRKE